jgi:hypothetical protein
MDWTKERDVVVANESFLIGVLQAVSGGALVAGLSQSEPVIRHAGKAALLLFLTCQTVSLLTSVLAAYWRHEYKLWNLKAGVSSSRGDEAEVRARAKKSDRALWRMRRAFEISVAGVIVGFVILIGAMWRLM